MVLLGCQSLGRKTLQTFRCTTKREGFLRRQSHITWQLHKQSYLILKERSDFRIKAVRPENFSVDITTTSSDLNDEICWEEKYSQNSNRYYHVLTAEERKAIQAEKIRLAR